MKINRAKDLSRVEFEGKKGRVVFHGDCNEMRAVCEAMCCRHEWWIGLSGEEYASGQYDADMICALTDKVCRDTAQPCVNRRFQLAKRPDMSCVYLQDDRCRIYSKRPRVCRVFQCQGGWQLAAISPAAKTSPGQKPHVLSQETFMKRLTKDMIFVLHPLIKVHTVFYLKSKKEIVFVKEMIGACGKFNTRDAFNYPQLDDAKIVELIDLFNRREPLSQAYRRFCSRSAGKLTRQEFYSIVWLLNKHNIILDSRNFKGMLGGMGAIG